MTASVEAPWSSPDPPPSPAQLEAITAPLGPVLVLAGPGSGKTFCLIGRIRHLIDSGIDPERICAFTFTNKAAGEIASRLERDIGARASLVRRSTLHSFCVSLLREHHEAAGVRRGFGIADDDYQKTLLTRLRLPAKQQDGFLKRVARHRFSGHPLNDREAAVFRRYEEFLRRRGILDFDQLVVRLAAVFEKQPAVAAGIASRWDCILVDEFQDLNPVQYLIIRVLGTGKGSVFAVGDEEQSIYSWAGADPALFRDFERDFAHLCRITLNENRRCPTDVFSLARRLIDVNPCLFDQRKEIKATREPTFPVRLSAFVDDDEELTWLIEDLRADRNAFHLSWGDIGLLYRGHRTGSALEAGLIKAGIPCRLARGRALTDHRVMRYLFSALRVIASPGDRVHQENFFRAILPPQLFDEVRSRSERSDTSLRKQIELSGRELPRDDVKGKRLRRVSYTFDNLAALGSRHANITSLVEDLLAQQWEIRKSILEDRSDEISDPADHDEVRALASRIETCRMEGKQLVLGAGNGLDTALRGLLSAAGYRSLLLERSGGADLILRSDARALGLPLSLFKALQLLSARHLNDPFRDYVSFDLETTGKDVDVDEIVEVGACRVRDGEIVDEFWSLVKPSRIDADSEANRVHGIPIDEIMAAPVFAEVWPAFSEFVGSDMLVAHNGYDFDFPILGRMSRDLPGARRFLTYDTLPLARDLLDTSKSLPNLAAEFGSPIVDAHRAINDARAIVPVLAGLNRLKMVRGRKTAQIQLLDWLGVALALDPPDNDEAKAFAEWCRPYSLGRYGKAIEWYRAERTAIPDDSAPDADEIIKRLGGVQLMARIREKRSARERYPEALERLQMILNDLGGEELAEQISLLLDRAALSAQDGSERSGDRVNLLTLHSTKGLEFSRVYVVGVEDGQFLKGPPESKPDAEVEEARRLLYVGMTRTIDRLTLTRAVWRDGSDTGGARFLTEMGLEQSGGS
ncbi:MAG: UvrD-helicase domain-containing protein [Gemmatimonadota bacterium]